YFTTLEFSKFLFIITFSVSSYLSDCCEFFHRLYQFFETPMTWKEAQAFCRANQADLATVDSMEDHVRLLESINRTDVSVWLGLTKSKTKRWMWSEGIGTVTATRWRSTKFPGFLCCASCAHLSSSSKSPSTFKTFIALLYWDLIGFLFLV
uniref:C-type lectin domain-containing protein n=1 Tax=Stegastes partitus TaxID=144197 RepID=A0A3B5ATJ5_9TELE